jgi:fatty-acyl-CoA synthase
METPLSPLDFARRARRLYGSRLAVVDGALRLTYTQFFERVDRWAAVLQGMGVQPGDRVAYVAPNGHQLLEGFYALAQIGAVMVPINYRLTPDDFAYIIDHCGAGVVCVDGEYVGAVAGGEQRVALTGDGFKGWLGYEQLLRSADVSRYEYVPPWESALLSINYTSGTTARPKGVMLTHRNNWANSINTLAHFNFAVGDAYLWTLPMFHCNGWTFVWTVTAFGGVHVCLRKCDPPEVFRLIRDEGVRWMSAAPTVLQMLSNAAEDGHVDVPRGLEVITAGAPPAAATIQRLEGQLGWNVTQVYGLTETSPFITICESRRDHDELDEAARCVIKARQGVEMVAAGDVRVFDDDDHEVPWDGETLGEIVARGNSVMAGYYRDEEATRRAFRGGWFRTGDAAVVHPDGYIEIRDRLKDVIISGGENISSVEVEGILLKHPEIRDVAVVGLPDARWGESPHAFVVRAPGSSLKEQDVVDFARAHLAHFKAPRVVVFVEELPRTATGKLQKYVLRRGKPGIGLQ